MSEVGDVERCGKRTKRGRVRQLGKKSIGIDIEFFLLDSGAEIEVEAPLESLADKVIIERNMPHFVKSSWDEVIGSIFFIHLLPLLEFFIIKQVFLGRVIGLIMSWQFLFHGSDVDDSSVSH